MKFDLFFIFTPISYVLASSYIKENHNKVFVFYGPRLKLFKFNYCLSIEYNPLYILVFFPIFLLLSKLKVLRIWLPHNGSRVLKLINNHCLVNYFVDDGTSAIIGIKANMSLDKYNYLLTFRDYKNDNSDVQFISGVTINYYLSTLNSYKAKNFNINSFKSEICVIQSYSISSKIWDSIIKRYTDDQITCFLHPINFKNRNIPTQVKNRVHSLPESLDCYSNDLRCFQEIYIGRSFTAIALLNTSSLNDSIINVCLDLKNDHLDKKFFLFLKKYYYYKKNLNYIIL